MNFKGVTVDWPLDTNVIRRNSLSNTFGIVRKNSDGSPRAHQGWDFYAAKGTPCHSVSHGRVEYAASRANLGNIVVISIGDTGFYAAYAHLDRMLVSKGDQVKLGQVIGLTGNTGNAYNMTGQDEHLHFEVRQQVLTGLGLENRVSPIEIFGKCPVNKAIQREFT